MMSDLLKDPNFLRTIIMDHYDYPRNFKLVKQEHYKEVHMASDSCIDDIYVEMLMEDGVITDVRFDGVGCTIAMSSTSIMTELVKGKTIEEATTIMNKYYEMIDGKECEEEVLQEAVAFRNVGRQANRIKCATIGWNGLEKLLKEGK